MQQPWLPMPADLSLAPNEVHLFLAATDSPPAPSLAHLETLLTEAELQKINRLRIPAKRTQSLLSRALLRQLLSRFLHQPPQQIPIHTAPTGKPFLENSPLRFNLSHTAGITLIAIALHHELGVDIEKISPDIELETLAHRYFTPAEFAPLMALPPGQRPPAFYRCWTRKEALLKATGQGLAGLATFTVPITEAAAPISVPAPFDAWTLHDLAALPEYLAALAINAPRACLHYHAVPLD